MIKILGCILILSASICACVFYESSEKSKLNAIKEINDFIKHIRSQIEYFCTPLDKIYTEFEHKTEIISCLANKGALAIKDYLDATDFELINTLFSELGKSVKSEQIALCSYTSKELEESFEKKKSELPNKIKAFRAIALFCGFCAVILII